MKIWTKSCPSNIAIVKYMGKDSSGTNEATNPSLSMTLEDFRTTVELSVISDSADRWEPLNSQTLSEKGQTRFLNFFQRLKERENIEENFLVRSGNNFPGDAGLASSASSFAALTLTAYTAFSELKNKTIPSAADLAQISRTGSGSSCRSFFSPWCLWNGREIHPVPANFPKLIDFVAILSAETKAVSSSDAHTRVQTSPLFHGRPERAKKRCTLAMNALEKSDYNTIAKVAWDDLWDMHSLFHTSDPSFSYFVPETIAVLKFSEKFRAENGWGPITTIDAGPNVHLLVPENKKDEFFKTLTATFPTMKFMVSQ